MKKKVLHLGKAFSSTFHIIKQYPLQTLLPMGVYILFMVPFQYFNLLTARKTPTASELISSSNFIRELIFIYGSSILRNILLFGFILLQFMLLCGYMLIINKWLNNGKPELKDFLKVDFELLGKYLAVTLIYGILIISGTLFFIIPGIIMTILYFFAEFILIDRRGGVRRSFGISDSIASGVMWELFGFCLMSGLIMSIAFVPFIFFIYKNFFLHQNINIHLIPLMSIITFLISFFIQVVRIFIYKDLLSQQNEIDALKNEKLQTQIN